MKVVPNLSNLWSGKKTLKSQHNKLVKTIKDKCKSEYWDTLLKYDFDKDYTAAKKWFNQLMKEKPPGKDVNALLFRIAYMVDEKSPTQTRCSVLIHGYNGYDPETNDYQREPYCPKQGIWKSTITYEAFNLMEAMEDDWPEIRDWVEQVYLDFYVRMIVYHLLKDLKKNSPIHQLVNPYICVLKSSDSEIDCVFQLKGQKIVSI
jgi:hypothetical protein